MAKAIYKGTVLAEADEFEEVEGNVYFPPDSLNKQYFADSSHSTVCPWKGAASYYHLKVDGEQLENAAWTYRNPKPKAVNIRDHVAFYKSRDLIVER